MLPRRLGEAAILALGTVGSACGEFGEASPAANGGPDAAASDAAAADGPSPDVTATSSYRDLVLADGAIAYYRLGEASGIVAADLAGQRPGKYFDCVLGEPGAIAGDKDTAARFDGTASYVALGGDGFDFAGTAAFSVEAWVSADRGADAAFPDFEHVFTEEWSDGKREGFALILDSGRPAFERFVADANVKVVASATLSDSFTHVVGTFDGATSRLFVDGVLVASAVDTRPLAASPGPALIGTSIVNDYRFAGVIDEVAIYARELSHAQIAAHHAAGRGTR